MNTINENKGTKILYFEGFEILNSIELHVIRGGNSEDKSKTKETDVYDTREG
jgi:hypothetical protein